MNNKKSASAHHCRLFLVTLSFLLTIAVVSTQLRYGISSHWTPQILSGSLPLEIIEEQVSDLEIREVIALPDDEFLLVVTTSGDRFRPTGSCSIALGSESVQARIVGAGSIGEGREGIRCRIDRQFRQKVNGSTGVRAQLRSAEGRIIGSSSRIPLLHWNRVVLESLITDQDVVLFTKGILPARKEEQERAIIGRTKCVFFNEDGSQIVAETQVLTLSQEIVRCRHPPIDIRDQLLGNKISIKTSDQIAPSAVLYTRPTIRERPSPPIAADSPNGHSLCACTMIYNGAKFLREWVRFHSHIGISRFFLYDNNSDDDLEKTVQELNSDESLSVRVTTRSWPWTKTQEAGFSHCAVTAREDCDWMAFVDVDEFIFPKAWTDSRSQPQEQQVYEDVQQQSDQREIISRMIDDAVAHRFGSVNGTSNETMIGQISLHCRDFGPSGQRNNPVEGVTQGYTCRVAKEHRHKSLVFLKAIDRSLANVIHHFKLNPLFKSARIPVSKGVVNHYKYQAWEEFKNKFRRRVSAYVTDWTESKNINSQDRTPGLSNQAIKPRDWETRFCEVEDTELKEYVVNVLKPQI